MASSNGRGPAPTGAQTGAPPSDLDAEAAVLGAMLLQPATTIEAVTATGLGPEHFHSPAHSHIATAIIDLHTAGHPIDALTVANRLERSGLLDDIGGHAVLLDCQAATPAISNAARYAAIVIEHWHRRQLITASAELADAARHGTDPAPILERLAQVGDARRTSGHRLELTPASEIQVDRPRWVWEERIPVGGTTLMPGREGNGKTALACWLAARLTRGQLPGQWHHRPTSVVYVGHEDDRSSVLVPRLIAAGADLERFRFIDLPNDGTFNIGTDLDDLANAIDRHCIDVALIIVDPLDSHLGNIDSHKKAEVQQAVTSLATLAQQLRCGALGLAHFNKAATTDLLTKVVGSVGFTTSVRSVLVVGEHPDQPDERVCVLAKANMTDRTTVPAVRFRPEQAHIPHPDDQGAITTVRIAILGQIDGFNPASILDAPADREERTALEDATEWLKSVLADGPMPKADVLRFAEHSKATVERAAARIPVVIERDESARGRPSTWSLPDSTDHASEASDYTSRVSPQDPLRHNPQRPDQEKHDSGVGYTSTMRHEAKPTGNETQPATKTGPLADLPIAACSVCGKPMAIVDHGQTQHPSCELYGPSAEASPARPNPTTKGNHDG